MKSTALPLMVFCMVAHAYSCTTPPAHKDHTTVTETIIKGDFQDPNARLVDSAWLVKTFTQISESYRINEKIFIILDSSGSSKARELADTSRLLQERIYADVKALMPVPFSTTGEINAKTAGILDSLENKKENTLLQWMNSETTGMLKSLRELSHYPVEEPREFALKYLPAFESLVQYQLTQIAE